MLPLFGWAYLVIFWLYLSLGILLTAQILKTFWVCVLSVLSICIAESIYLSIHPLSVMSLLKHDMSDHCASLWVTVCFIKHWNTPVFDWTWLLLSTVPLHMMKHASSCEGGLLHITHALFRSRFEAHFKPASFFLSIRLPCFGSALSVFSICTDSKQTNHSKCACTFFLCVCVCVCCVCGWEWLH